LEVRKTNLEGDHAMRALLAYANRTTPTLEEVTPPDLGDNDVRIAVAAGGINIVDIGIASGAVRAAAELPDPIGLGWDVSGHVIEAGANVSHVRPGDRVAGFLNIIAIKPQVGTHADSTILSGDAVAVVPDSLNLEDVAALPLAVLTASQAVNMFGPAEARTLLITGGAGALGGHAAVLAARAGWDVTVLARASDAAFADSIGAKLVTELPSATFDAVLDAAIMREDALGAVRDDGFFINCAPAATVESERGIHVETVFARSDTETLAELLDLAAADVLKVRVAGKRPLTEAADLYDQVVSGGQRGRWLLIP